MLILSIFLTLTSGCTSVKQLEIFQKPVERQPLNLEKPAPASLSDIKWIIITSENAEEVFAKLKEGNTDPVIFGLTDEDYELLSKNFAQIRAYMLKQNQIIDEYKKYYEPSKQESKK